MRQKKATRQWMLNLFLMTFSLGLGTGCVGLLTRANKVVFVPESDGMVRLAEDVEGHVYHYRDGEWHRSVNKVQLPEGWYAGSLGEEK